MRRIRGDDLSSMCVLARPGGGLFRPRGSSSALSAQLQCWPKSYVCRQHEQHIRAEVPPSTFHERRDSRLRSPSFLAASTLSPAFLLDVLAQCRQRIGPHLSPLTLSNSCAMWAHGTPSKGSAAFTSRDSFRIHPVIHRVCSFSASSSKLP